MHSDILKNLYLRLKNNEHIQAHQSKDSKVLVLDKLFTIEQRDVEQRFIIETLRQQTSNQQNAIQEHTDQLKKHILLIEKLQNQVSSQEGIIQDQISQLASKQEHIEQLEDNPDSKVKSKCHINRNKVF